MTDDDRTGAAPEAAVRAGDSTSRAAASPPVIAAVMVHVSNLAEALAWYARAFPSAVRDVIPGTACGCLVMGATRLEFVPADDKVASGPAGTVVYWSVPDFEDAVARLQAAGATLYRGPMRIENGRAMCQVQDPWGNCIGLRGPSRTSSAAASGAPSAAS